MAHSSPGLCLNVAFSGAFPDHPNEMATNPVLSSSASLLVCLLTAEWVLRSLLCSECPEQQSLGCSRCSRNCCEMGEWGGRSVRACMCVHTHTYICMIAGIIYICIYIYVIDGIIYLRIYIRSEFGGHKIQAGK